MDAGTKVKKEKRRHAKKKQKGGPPSAKRVCKQGKLKEKPDTRHIKGRKELPLVGSKKGTQNETSNPIPTRKRAKTGKRERGRQGRFGRAQKRGRRAEGQR